MGRAILSTDQYDVAAAECHPCWPSCSVMHHEPGCPGKYNKSTAARMRELCAEKDAEIERLKAVLQDLIGWAEHYSMANTPLLNQSITNAKVILGNCAKEKVE
jgi:hypothetical protein